MGVCPPSSTVKRLRILYLVNEEKVPPNSCEGVSPEELRLVKVEYDVLATLRELGHDVRVVGVPDELTPVRNAIDEFQPHVAFNLVMHMHGVGVYDAHLISWLELRKLAYTGNNPRGLLVSHDKALSKKILAYHRIRVPGFAVFPHRRQVRRPKRLKFPLIVKALAEHASMGISQASIVYDDESLSERVEFIHRNVSPWAIAEQYIPGRELNIGVLGNQRLQVGPVWELLFPNLPKGSEPIATSAAKWDKAYQERIGLRSGPAEGISEEQQAELARLAKRVYRALGLSGYARIDLRMDEEGRAYVLEANPNPDLSFGEDFAEAFERVGYSYSELVQKIITLGLSFDAPWKFV